MMSVSLAKWTNHGIYDSVIMDQMNQTAGMSSTLDNFFV